jgi:uncharacterized protein
MLYAAVQHRRDAEGAETTLHYIRDKEHREIDFVICEQGEPVRLIESKWSDPAIPAYLAATAVRFPKANATLLLRHARHREQHGAVIIEPAAQWLASAAI